MKRVISIISALAILVGSLLINASAEDIDTKNVCYKKPVLGSSRLQEAEMYPLNLTDGNRNLRASSYFLDLSDPYEWFRIDLGADYTISEVVIEVRHDFKPKSLAVDVWSNGKWVRVAEDYNITPSEYPCVYYFDEIDASYIMISTNEIPSCNEGTPVDVLAFTLSEVEAYHTKNISAEEKAVSIEKVPDGKKKIPTPEPLNEYLFKAGLRTDSSVSPTIPEDALMSFVGQYELDDYTSADLKYINAIYKNAKEEGNTISFGGSALLEEQSTNAAS